VVRATPGLLSYWRLDEATGNVAADSVGGNDATFAGTPMLGVAGALNDPSNRAVSFNGTTTELAANPTLLGTPPSVTVEAWVQVRSQKAASHQHTVVTLSLSDFADGFILDVNSFGTAAALFAASSTTTLDLTGSTVLTLNRWYHLAATFDGTTGAGNLYVDGVSEASGTLAQPLLYAAGRALQLGKQVKSTSQSLRYLDGQLDEVAIYSRALAATEINQHHQAGLQAVTGQDAGSTADGGASDAGGATPADGGSSTPDLDGGLADAGEGTRALDPNQLRLGCGCDSTGSTLVSLALLSTLAWRFRQARRPS
jgi:hypothetical protein